MKIENKASPEDWNGGWWQPPRPGTSITVDFCNDSSLHGLKYIAQPRRHLAERIFWMIAFLMAVAVAAYFILLVWNKYQQSPIIVSFQPTETSIDQIPFPAITICNVNNALRETAENYIAKAQKLIDANEYDEAAFADLYYLDHICETGSFTKNFNFKQERSVDKTLVDRVIAEINTTSLREMTEFFGRVAQSCEDMIPLCQWGDEIQNCSHLFFPTETNYGFCCTFNMVPTSLLQRLRKGTAPLYDEDEVQEWSKLDLTPENIILPSDPTVDWSNARRLPRRQMRAGKSSGLTVLLNPDLDNYFCTSTDSSGFQLETHLPLSFPKPAENGLGVRPNSEIFMDIKPDMTVADDNILNFPLQKRQCYFGKEMVLRYYNFYTSSNCVDECIANITYRNCDCVRYYMPRGRSRNLCGPMKFNCTEAVRRQIDRDGLREVCKICLPLCTEIVYTVDVTTMPLRTDVNLWQYPDGKDSQWVGKNVSILHLFMGTDSTYPRVRSELYGATDLLSNTGGILGLCLGFSGLSLLEVLYFFTLRAWCRSRGGRKLNEKISATAVKIWGKTSPKSDTNVVGIGNESRRRTSNSYATVGEFRNWVVGPAPAKNTSEISYQLSPIYQPQRWNPI